MYVLHTINRLNCSRFCAFLLFFFSCYGAHPLLPLSIRRQRQMCIGDRRYTREGGGEMYVSRGIGVTGPPVRFAASPEVVRVTLSGRRRSSVG